MTGALFGRFVSLTAIAGGIVAETRLISQLSVLHKPFGGQLAALDRRADGTARLPAVLAVGKPALCGKIGDVLKRTAKTLCHVPHAQLAHAGGVDDKRAAGQAEKRPMRRRVAAARIAFAHCAGLHDAFTRERVDKARFARAG